MSSRSLLEFIEGVDCIEKLKEAYVQDSMTPNDMLNACIAGAVLQIDERIKKLEGKDES